MTALVFYVLVAFGLAFVVGHAKISGPFREWVWGDKRAALVTTGLSWRRWFVTGLECPACVGVWIGAFSSAALLPTSLGLAWSPPSWAWPLVLGTFTGGANFLLAHWSGLDE